MIPWERDCHWKIPIQVTIILIPAVKKKSVQHTSTQFIVKQHQKNLALTCLCSSFFAHFLPHTQITRLLRKGGAPQSTREELNKYCGLM